MALVRNDGFQFTDTFFPYASGEIGPYYVEPTVVENSGRDYRKACQSMARLIKNHASVPWDFVISGGESRDWDFSNPVAAMLGRPHFKIYKDGRTKGARDIAGKTVMHIADLNNQGSSPRDMWVPAIQKAGGIIEDIFFYVDKMEDGVQVMKDLGLRSHAVVPLDEHAWDILQKYEVIIPKVYNSLRARMEDKDTWARAMLRSDAGFENLKLLFMNPKTNYKARKILGTGDPLGTGYPNLLNEFLERLNKAGVSTSLIKD